MVSALQSITPSEISCFFRLKMEVYSVLDLQYIADEVEDSTLSVNFEKSFDGATYESTMNGIFIVVKIRTVSISSFLARHDPKRGSALSCRLQCCFLNQMK